MTIANIFNATPAQSGGVTLTLKRSVRTTDGRMLTTLGKMLPANIARQIYRRGPRAQVHGMMDTVLSAETTRHNPNMMGSKNWAGDIKEKLSPLLDSLSVADRKVALDSLRRFADDYENQGTSAGIMGAGPAGSHATVVDDDDPYVGMGADPQSINDANRKAWDKANKFVTRDARPRNLIEASVQQMQRANDEYWSKQTQHQRTPAKEWGKG
jgi:hypothetical protein